MAPTLPPAPHRVDDDLGAPRFGTYEGSMELVDFSGLAAPYRLNAVQRLTRFKKWLYTFVATKEVAVLSAVVDLGYTSNAFVMAVNLKSGEVLCDESFLGPPRPMVTVNDSPGPGLEVRFNRPGARFHFDRPYSTPHYRLDVSTGPALKPSMSLHVEGLATGIAPPITVVAPVEGGIVNVTQKSVGLHATGALVAKGRTYRLDGGLLGLDSTYGYLARHTAWRWGFGVGRTGDGTPMGFNLVEGFNESRDDVNENALWVGTQLVPLGRARFTWNHEDVLEPWHVKTSCGTLDARFKPIAAHREHRDLKLVKSTFIQPVGLWSGTAKVDGKTVSFVDVPGVTEDQDVLW